jgi:CRP-like cAMP-binding protein
MSQLEWLPAAFRKNLPVREVRAGATLFHQGDAVTAIFEVETGRLRLVRHAIDGHPIVLHTARAGELFAEAALFARAYHCDAVAVVDSRVRAYPKRALRALLRGNPDHAERFMALLARQVHAVRARLEERNIRSARERILHHLALAAGTDGRTVRLEGTLVDLAAELGLTHEVLYRTLAVLQKEGTIARMPRQIVLRRRRRP